MNQPEPIHVLMVDDDPVDLRITREALFQAKMHLQISEATDGEDALAFLRREGRHAEASRPDVIILDLNMPRMDGFEFLDAMKGDPELRAIPVVVLTTSEDDAHVLKSYDLQAACFLSKPVVLESFVNMVQSFDNFWLSVVRLPPRMA